MRERNWMRERESEYVRERMRMRDRERMEEWERKWNQRGCEWERLREETEWERVREGKWMGGRERALPPCYAPTAFTAPSLPNPPHGFTPERWRMCRVQCTQLQYLQCYGIFYCTVLFTCMFNGLGLFLDRDSELIHKTLSGFHIHKQGWSSQ